MMANLQKAYLGMQCFWGAESTFAKLDGVLATRVGYAGGTTLLPNYKNIGDHTEITEIQFDEKIISYDKILDCFWENHDPTVIYKKQYQSAILYVNDQQKETAQESLKKLQEKYGNKKLNTYIQKLVRFYQAEDYHQKYWLRCQTAILKKELNQDVEMVDKDGSGRRFPEVEINQKTLCYILTDELKSSRSKYYEMTAASIGWILNLSDEEVVSSVLATKVNAFLTGYKNFDVLKHLANKYQLDNDVTKLIEDIALAGGVETSSCHV